MTTSLTACLTISPRGGLGNRMIQYMVALKLAKVFGLTLSQICLPEWGISVPDAIRVTQTLTKVYEIDSTHHVKWDTLADTIRELAPNLLRFSGYGQRMENFLPRDQYQEVFSESSTVAGLDDSCLLCNIRGAEIFEAVHPNYTLLPIQYYRSLERLTGLRLVFFGQLSNNRYIRSLQDAFPRAEFIVGRGGIHDFEMIRHSRNIAIAVSTFSWLAAWLSNAAHVFFPVSGLFNPNQARLIDLIPLDDRRYHFCLFPINYAVNAEDVLEHHERMVELWRWMSSSTLSDLLYRSPRFPRNLEDYARHFDEAYYMRSQPDVKVRITLGEVQSAWEHYETIGFIENRRCFFVDYKWYASTYPIAALEVGQGDWQDFNHHYSAVGWLRGYTTRPI